MERLLSIGNDGRKKQVRAELKPYRAIFKVDEALKIPENTLERLLLQEVRGTYETSEKSENLFMDLHESMTADYFAKLTAATVFFFSCNPWAALFWPPYYYYYSHKR